MAHFYKIKYDKSRTVKTTKTKNVKKLFYEIELFWYSSCTLLDKISNTL